MTYCLFVKSEVMTRFYDFLRYRKKEFMFLSLILTDLSSLWMNMLSFVPKQFNELGHSFQNPLKITPSSLKVRFWYILCIYLCILFPLNCQVNIIHNLHMNKWTWWYKVYIVLRFWSIQVCNTQTQLGWLFLMFLDCVLS